MGLMLKYFFFSASTKIYFRYIKDIEAYFFLIQKKRISYFSSQVSENITFSMLISLFRKIVLFNLIANFDPRLPQHSPETFRERVREKLGYVRRKVWEM